MRPFASRPRMSSKELLSTFATTKLNEEWAFQNTRSNKKWTHGYHRYPAKFIPNIVEKLIEKYTKPNDLILDPFAGCGTTLVEAKAHGRNSIGVDVNPVAKLITESKIRAIEPYKLSLTINRILQEVANYKPGLVQSRPRHDRIDYWFNRPAKEKIEYLYQLALAEQDEELRTFLLVAVSNILKNCSRWLQSSTKPQIDKHKMPKDPLEEFRVQLSTMSKANQSFYEELNSVERIHTESSILLEDARQTTLENASVDAIITSPPYVTSYEYADIHQLTGYWMEFIDELSTFREKFIGTYKSKLDSLTSDSAIGQCIIDELKQKDKVTGLEVAGYFFDMMNVAVEMNRVLKPGGYACVVIGNTTQKGVKIRSSEVFAEHLLNNGFELVELIKRAIPNKLIPTIRDTKTGRFTSLDNKNSKRIYPEEFVIITKKTA